MSKMPGHKVRLIVCIIAVFFIIAAFGAFGDATSNITAASTNNTSLCIQCSGVSSAGLDSASSAGGNQTPSAHLSLDKIKSAIRSHGAKWEAGDTSVSNLTPDQQKRLLGVIPKVGKTPGLTFNESEVAPETGFGAGLPASLDWRIMNGSDWTTGIRNQGVCGSCWAFGTLGAVESRVKIALNDSSFSPDYSEQQLVSCAVSNGCAGASIPAPYNYVEQNGVVDESVFPYVSGGGAAPACPGTLIGTRHKISDWRAIITGNETDIKNALSRGPITATFAVYTDFYSYQSGVYTYTSGVLEGYHAVTMVGWGQDSQGTYWICKNSWGPGWGSNGWFMIRSGAVEINDELYEPVTGPVPKADFDAATVSGNSPLNVVFTDKSTNNPTSWQWNFGDNSPNVTTRNTSHLYTQPGTYTVTLTVANQYFSNTKQNPGYVQVYSVPVPPVSDFTANVTSGIVPLAVQFNDTSTGSPTAWNWSFGDSTWFNTTNPDSRNTTKLYASAGTYTVTLLVSNIQGQNVTNPGTLITVNPPPPNNAEITAYSIPSAMEAYHSYPVYVTVKNTGSAGWNSTLRYRLGTVGDGAGVAAQFGPTRYVLPTGVTIAPGQSNTFSFIMTAPGSPGSYAPQYRMVRDGVSWFGPVLSQPITVTPAQAYDAVIVNSTIPANMVHNQTYAVTVTVKNVGTNTWTSALRYRLGGLASSPLFGPQRISVGTNIAPGQTTTFSFNMVAPATLNVYTVQYQMVRDGVTWFGDILTKQITVN